MEIKYLLKTFFVNGKAKHGLYLSTFYIALSKSALKAEATPIATALAERVVADK
jgi:hypothetical protein